MNNPEIGKSIQLGPVATNYQDVGTGTPVLMIHGCSGRNGQRRFL